MIYLKEGFPKGTPFGRYFSFFRVVGNFFSFYRKKRKKTPYTKEFHDEKTVFFEV